MAAIESAMKRRRSTLDAVTAAQRVLDATQARWDVGAVSLFEVEDARRQLAIALGGDDGGGVLAIRQGDGLFAVTVHATTSTTMPRPEGTQSLGWAGRCP